jgi:hypothetical protein
MLGTHPAAKNTGGVPASSLNLSLCFNATSTVSTSLSFVSQPAPASCSEDSSMNLGCPQEVFSLLNSRTLCVTKFPGSTDQHVLHQVVESRGYSHD